MYCTLHRTVLYFAYCILSKCCSHTLQKGSSQILTPLITQLSHRPFHTQPFPIFCNASHIFHMAFKHTPSQAYIQYFRTLQNFIEHNLTLNHGAICSAFCSAALQGFLTALYTSVQPAVPFTVLPCNALLLHCIFLYCMTVTWCTVLYCTALSSVCSGRNLLCGQLLYCSYSAREHDRILLFCIVTAERQARSSVSFFLSLSLIYFVACI